MLLISLAMYAVVSMLYIYALLICANTKKTVNFYFSLYTSVLGYKWGQAVKFFENMIILHKKKAFERRNSPFMLDPRPILSVDVR